MAFTWTYVSTGVPFDSGGIAWVGGKFIGFDYGSADVGTSVNGVAWTNHAGELPVTGNWSNNICTHAGKAVNVSWGSGGGGKTVVGDIGAWTSGLLGVAANWNAAASDGTTIVAVRPGTSCAYSTNGGATWTSATIAGAVSGNTWSAVASSGSLFCMVDDSNSTAAVSPDGVSWTKAADFALNGQPLQLVWNGAVFVAMDHSGIIDTSADGITWNHYAIGTLGWSSLIAFGRILVAARDNSKDVAISLDDGQTWTETLGGSGSQLWYGTAHNGVDTIVFGGTNAVLVGVSDTPIPTTPTTPDPTPNDGKGIVFDALIASPETLGDTVMQMPRLQFRASELDRALRCDLPLLQFAATGEMTAQDVGDLVMTLPAFDWYADNVDVGVLTTYRGFIRAALPPLALSGNVAAEPIPQSADAVFVLPPIGFAATGFQKLTGNLIMTLPAFKMFAFDSAGQHLIMELPPPSFAASNRTTIVRNAVSMQAQPVMSLLASNTWVMTDTLTLNDTVLDELFFVLKDRLALNDNVSMLGVFVGTVTSSLVARDFVRFVLDMAIDETLTLTEQLVITPTAILALASQLMLQDQSLGLMNAIAVITSGLVLLDRLRQDATATIDSALDLADIVEANLTLITTLASEALLTDEALGSMTLMGMVSSDLQLADSADALLTLLMTLDDTASFVVRFSTPEGDQFAGYMVNIRNAAVSSVTNYNFNSFATLKRGGRNVTLAFKPGGVYQLGGKTDDGAAIPARVRLGLSDFGTSALKRVANAILGYTSDGRLRLKVITTDGGRKKENWYALKPRAADSPVEGRLDIAKGLVARYWGFELTNVDGADFKLDELKVWPMLLQRHKSGR